jgi:hypothetical protein
MIEHITARVRSIFRGLRRILRLVEQAGEECRIPFDFLDAEGKPIGQVARFTIAPGESLRTIAHKWQTPAISFASFDVVGLDINFKAVELLHDGRPNRQMLVNVIGERTTVDGSPNLQYAPLDLIPDAQLTETAITAAYVTKGLRAAKLDKGMQAQCSVAVRQEITNQTPIEGAMTLALVVRKRDDAGIFAWRGPT